MVSLLPITTDSTAQWVAFSQWVAFNQWCVSDSQWVLLITYYLLLTATYLLPRASAPNLQSQAFVFGNCTKAPPNERKSHKCLNVEKTHVPCGGCRSCSEAVQRRHQRRRIIAVSRCVHQTWE